MLGNTAAQAERLSGQLPFSHEMVGAGASEADVIVTLRFGAAEAALRPRLLHMPGAGVDAVDFTLVPDDCTVCNVFEHEGPIAEYVLLAMLDWEIGYSAMFSAFSSGSWSDAYRTRLPHGELAGKAVGVVGYGHIGAAIAIRAAAFGMKVRAVASRPRAVAPPVEQVGGPDELEAMLAASDYVVIACPLTETTRGMVGAVQLAHMKPSAVLINIARGDIVDEAALYDALANQRFAGAVLDAWYTYPGPSGDVAPSRYPFDRLPNVRCTPHASAWTDALFARRYAVIAENIRRFNTQQPLRNVVRAGRARAEA